jgi:hypothetical protein
MAGKHACQLLNAIFELCHLLKQSQIGEGHSGDSAGRGMSQKQQSSERATRHARSPPNCVPILPPAGEPAVLQRTVVVAASISETETSLLPCLICNDMGMLNAAFASQSYI